MTAESDEAAISGRVRNCCILSIPRLLSILLLAATIAAVYWNSSEIRLADKGIDARSAMELAQKLSLKSHPIGSKEFKRSFQLLLNEASQLQEDLKVGPSKLQIHTQTVQMALKRGATESGEGSVSIRNLILVLAADSYEVAERSSYAITAHYGSAPISSGAYGDAISAAVAFEANRL
jgi:hypothetical protein